MSPSASSPISPEMDGLNDKFADMQVTNRPPSPADSTTTMGTSVQQSPVKLLELYAGTGSVGKVAETLKGFGVWSLDKNQETAGYAPNKVADILEFDYHRLKFVPDVIWAR